MAKKQNNDLRRYAVVGAEQRLLELASEAARIFQVFPELRGRGRGLDAVRSTAPTSPSPESEPQGGKRKRRRSTMSAEGRKRISDAQKARWARKKAATQAPTAVVGAARKKR